MKTFEVVFYETKRYTKLVEAESEDDARSLCDFVEMDELVEDVDFYDMEIVDVTEADWLEEGQK
jgi:hypothetical protein